jgi:hypothetical protein
MARALLFVTAARLVLRLAAASFLVMPYVINAEQDSATSAMATHVTVRCARSVESMKK